MIADRENKVRRFFCFALLSRNQVVSQFEFIVPPVMEAKLIKRLMSIDDIANLVVDEAPKKEAIIRGTI